ncbi:unnamed protein product, partial [Polarella glacialis]
MGLQSQSAVAASGVAFRISRALGLRERLLTARLRRQPGASGLRWPLDGRSSGQRQTLPVRWAAPQGSATATGSSTRAAVGGKCAVAATAPTHVVEFVSCASHAQRLVEELLASGRDSKMGGSYAAKAQAQESEGEGRADAQLASIHEVVLRADGPAVALDCEGVRLGRFGRVCLIQIASSTSGRLFLCDALRPGVVEALAPLLESPDVAKVMHDCREDSAALFHQHGVELRAVFDTQAAHSVLERRKGSSPYQVSSAELLRSRLAVRDPPETAELKSLMLRDPQLWARRPLPGPLVRYALHGVAKLP